MKDTLSTYHVHVPEDAPVKAKAMHNMYTPSLSIDAGTANVVLFLWGDPQQAWDSLDAIIDAANALKRQIVFRHAGITEPAPIHVAG